MTSTMDSMRELRALAQRVAATTRDPSLLEDVRGEVQRSLVGIDPESVERDEPGYRAGLGEALLAVLTALEERSLSRDAIRLLLKAHRARVLAAVAQHAGLNQKDLAAELELAASNLNDYLGELGGLGFIEPAAPEGGRGVAFQITPWGIQAMDYLRSHHPDILPRPLAKVVRRRDQAVRGAAAMKAAPAAVARGTLRPRPEAASPRTAERRGTQSTGPVRAPAPSRRRSESDEQ